MNWLLIISLIATAASVCALVVLFRTRTGVAIQQQQLEEVMSNQSLMQENLNLLRRQLQELQSASEQKQRLIPAQQVQLEQHQAELDNLQSAIQLLQSEFSENKLYTRAKKMIEMGAGLDEVIADCDMPRGEAELLFSLYRK